MSELKIYHHELRPNEYDEFYLKYEADKVIAEKDKEIARLEAIRKVHVEAIASMEAGLHQDEKEIRRHKYKRCLAMARWCKRKRIDAADYRIPRGKWEFYDKWSNRWLEVAEKFKEAK